VESWRRGAGAGSWGRRGIPSGSLSPRKTARRLSHFIMHLKLSPWQRQPMWSRLCWTQFRFVPTQDNGVSRPSWPCNVEGGDPESYDVVRLKLGLSRLSRHGKVPAALSQQTTSTACFDAQAIFRRRRHQARRPPLAKMRPGSPAPAIGPGT
jgi:hypothetical protein